MPPELNRRRAEAVLSRIDAILAWERRHENERDTRFVELGKCLCEVRAGQYWRLEKLKSFDRVSGAPLSGVAKESLLPDVDPRTAASAGKEGAEADGLDEGRELAKLARQAGTAVRKCTLGAQSPARCRKRSSSGRWKRS